MRERRSTEDRQQQIARAALKIIARDGLGKFTAAAVAQEVGISDATIFRHFASMEDVVNAAIDRLSEVLDGAFFPDDADPLDRLGAFIKRRFRLITTEPAILKLFFSEQLAQAAGKTGVEKIRRVQQGALAFIRDCLAEAKSAGLLRDGLRVDELATVVQGAIVGELLRFVFAEHAADGPPEKRGRRVWRTVELLIRAPEKR
jgi:AcrR family transcriptional regulator